MLAQRKFGDVYSRCRALGVLSDRATKLQDFDAAYIYAYECVQTFSDCHFAQEQLGRALTHGLRRHRDALQPFEHAFTIGMKVTSACEAAWVYEHKLSDYDKASDFSSKACTILSEFEVIPPSLYRYGS
jgi:hypothetical protein